MSTPNSSMTGDDVARIALSAECDGALVRRYLAGLAVPEDTRLAIEQALVRLGLVVDAPARADTTATDPGGSR